MDGKVTAFNAIEATGFFTGLIILLTAIVSRDVKRLPTWYLVMTSTIVYSGSMSLLAVAGKQSGALPGFDFCLFQSALIYASPAWVVSSGLAFAVQFHLSVQHYLQQRTSRIRRDSKWLLAVPTAIFAIVIIIVIIIGELKPGLVQRGAGHNGQFYCGFTDYTGAFIVSATSVICVLTALIVEGFTARMIYLHWKACANLSLHYSGTISAQTIFRLIVFSVITLLSIVTCGLYLLPLPSDNVILYNAILAQFAILAIGLNSGIVKAWMFWRKPGTINRTALPKTAILVEQTIEQKV